MSVNVKAKFSLINQEDQECPAAVRFFYWGGLLKIQINRIRILNNDKLKYDDPCNIFLSPFKARIFANQIEKVLKGEVPSAGVDTPKGIIYITFNVDRYVLVIKKGDNSDFPEGFYPFRTQYYYGIDNVKGLDNYDGVDKNSYDNLEIEMFVTMLKQYSDAMNYAVGYSVAESLSEPLGVMNDRIASLCRANGVPIDEDNNGYNGGYNNGGGYNGNKFGGSSPRGGYSNMSDM